MDCICSKVGITGLNGTIYFAPPVAILHFKLQSTLVENCAGGERNEKASMPLFGDRILANMILTIVKKKKILYNGCLYLGNFYKIEMLHFTVHYIDLKSIH